MQQEVRLGPGYTYTDGTGEPPPLDRVEAYTPKTGNAERYLAYAKYTNPLTAWMASMHETREETDAHWKAHFDKVSAGQEKLSLFKLQPVIDDQAHTERRANYQYLEKKKLEAETPRRGTLLDVLAQYSK
eukprot:CAMPEP_0181197776 /NCGR_PEP_ID=MMETSP1096-20121128/16232_1 /TAXON_ID=156174 ORGANISM="Chrysochromulina ericina, Strain CCMP281" /NCGR_SAMPLE_ID=MMETSP1096 /ASSEMBLY_ACC=CAM_ASM_000453 /LENGTH=129 /DNA_ID=CAMNT_0023287731 /DNA_START=68 /DNA_END=457 /DNA_ORIENTATION=+